MAYKAKSITSKASSACRMNAALVAGHTATGTAKKTGMDHFKKGVKKDLPAPKPKPKPKTPQPPKTPPPTEDTEETVETEGKQSTNAVDPN